MNNYIEGYCRTNLDYYQRYQWPTQFAAVPRVGERVLTTCGLQSLKVVSVTHFVSLEGPKINIELHK